MNNKTKETVIHPHGDFALSVHYNTGEIKNWAFTYDEDLNLLFADQDMSKQEGSDIAKFIVAHSNLEELPPFDNPSKPNAWTAEKFFAFYNTVQLTAGITKVELNKSVSMSFSARNGFGQFTFTPIEDVLPEWQEKYGAEHAKVSPYPIYFTAMNEIVAPDTLCDAWVALFKLVRRSSDYRIKTFTQVMTLSQLLSNLEPDNEWASHILHNCFSYRHDKGTAYLDYQNYIEYNGHNATVSLQTGRAFLKQLLSDTGTTLVEDRFSWLRDEDNENTEALVVNKPCYTLITEMLKASPTADQMVNATLTYKVLEKLPWAGQELSS